MLYRATDLADASCALVDAENLLSAACTTRAFQETLAALFYVNRKVKMAINDKNVSALDETLMKALMGSRNNPDMPEPINVLKMVERVKKEMPGFRDIYDILSELSHPNWAGTLGIYTKTDTEKLWTDFAKNIRPKGNRREQIVFTLHTGLELIVHIYNEFAELLPQLVTVCEKAIGSNAVT